MEQNNATPRPPKSGLSIILADRDKRFKMLAQSFLEGAGHQVTFAEDGLDALALVRSERPQVLVTEIMLPKLDGLALCRAIKTDTDLARTRVLIFSILAASGRAKEAGADGFLSKPLVQTRLAAALTSLMTDVFRSSDTD